MGSAWRCCCSLDCFVINLIINLLHLARLKVIRLVQQPAQGNPDQVAFPGRAAPARLCRVSLFLCPSGMHLLQIWAQVEGFG